MMEVAAGRVIGAGIEAAATKGSKSKAGGGRNEARIQEIKGEEKRWWEWGVEGVVVGVRKLEVRERTGLGNTARAAPWVLAHEDIGVTHRSVLIGSDLMTEP
jgi:hypothetical protein